MDRKAEDAYVYDEGKQIMLFKLVANGNIDLQTASEQSGMTKEEFERKMEEAGYWLP